MILILKVTYNPSNSVLNYRERKDPNTNNYAESNTIMVETVQYQQSTSIDYMYAESNIDLGRICLEYVQFRPKIPQTDS